MSLVATLFPNGVVHYLLGGALIGLGTAVIYLATAVPAGASTFLESTLSYVSRLERFHRPAVRASRDWRLVFTAGIVLGAAASTLATGGGWWTTDVQPWRLLLGGVLVGVGTRVGKGCTSGHGICGVSSAAPSSLINVATFVLVAIGVANLVAAAGVTP